MPYTRETTVCWGQHMSISGTNDSDTRSSKMEKKIYNLLRSITIYKV